MKTDLKKLIREKVKPQTLFRNEWEMGYIIGINEGLSLLTTSEHIDHDFEFDVMKYELLDRYGNEIAEVLNTMDELEAEKMFFDIWDDFDEVLENLGEKYFLFNTFIYMDESNLRIYLMFPIESLLDNYKFDEEMFVEKLLKHYEEVRTKENIDFETYLEEYKHEVRKIYAEFLSLPNIRLLIKEFEKEALKIIDKYKKIASAKELQETVEKSEI